MKQLRFSFALSCVLTCVTSLTLYAEGSAQPPMPARPPAAPPLPSVQMPIMQPYVPLVSEPVFREPDPPPMPVVQMQIAEPAVTYVPAPTPPAPPPPAPQPAAAPSKPFALNKLALFSSGMGFFEHSGSVTGSATIPLVFNAGVVNDVLKSLMINDPDSTEYSILYPTEQSLNYKLQSLKVDLSGNPSITSILSGLKGAEVAVFTPSLVTGRIVSVEGDFPIRPLRAGDAAAGNRNNAAVTLFTKDGVKVILLADVSSFSFKDPAINADMTSALNLLAEANGVDNRTLNVKLSGATKRDIALSYVIPTAVWKVSYRLNLAGDKPYLQGWAIVDNDSDTDWNGVELSLVTGGPDSFIQNIYKPYHVARRTVPLVIEGVEVPNRPQPTLQYDGATAMDESVVTNMKAAPLAPESLAGSAPATPRGQDAAEQFEYKFPKPVTIAHQQSVMIPLVNDRDVTVDKTLLFSSSRPGAHPDLAVELRNTTGNKLPAGAVTVYDGGTYAGDALLSKFFPPNDRQYLSYGKDLSVSSAMKQAAPEPLPTANVEIAQGVLIITRATKYTTTYEFSNKGADQKVIVEHHIGSGRVLQDNPVNVEDENPSFWQYWQYWRNDTAHYFKLPLPAGRESALIIEETRNEPVRRISLANISLKDLNNHAANEEFSQQTRDKLKKLAGLLKDVDSFSLVLTQRLEQRDQLQKDRTSILQSGGLNTAEGIAYHDKELKANTDSLTTINTSISESKKSVDTAQEAYDAEIRLSFKDY
jgi:hypothetical protein